MRIVDGDQNQVLVDTGGPLAGSGQGYVNDAGQVVLFAVFDDGSEGTLLVDSESMRVLATNGDGILSASGAAINNFGELSYVLRRDDGLEQIVVFDGASSRVIADNSGLFHSFGVSDISDGGDIIVSGMLDDGRQAIGALFGGPERILVAVGDTLDGQLISEIFFNRDAFNNRDQFAFAARFADGSSAIYRGTIDEFSTIPNPAAAFLFLTALFGLAGLQRKVHSAQAQPA